MQQDDEVKRLKEGQRQELVEVLDSIYVAERDILRKSGDFIENRFRRITMSTYKAGGKSGKP